MTSEFRLESSDSKKLHDELHIGKKDGAKIVKADLKAFKYQDKETKQYVIYIPSVEISAYGETKEKAEEMIHFSLEDFCIHLSTLSTKDLQKELKSLGWKSHVLRNKDYSRTYVDVTGELKGFAVNEKVEQQNLVSCK